ncbi:ABC transporter ATP-binding protein [Williamsia sp. 1135]|uniref:ABC transporter ATP-binding protein n=1 Tax=Williamsia sp. 1135 TaxID=1889262 RepID=UPI000A109990|nr:ABC transporter ATP-binding protein [Williamsia sp. 1135]ORM32498.1 ABC transporter ATP-binding protein [Williamsia sp. 1135]
MSALTLHGVTKVFDGSTVLDSVELAIPDGEFMVLLGPSGCGKSTLLRIIAGLETPSAGTVVIDGIDVTDLPPRERDLAMVFQSYALYPHLSVAKNIAFPLKTARVPKRTINDAVQSVAGALGLRELLDRRPGQLSGGQRQRVALGRAMVRDPGAFLMDEPLSNLDARLRAVTRTELIALHQRVAKTFLYVTHDQVEAMTMADRIALLNEGRIEQVGTPEQLYDHPESAFVAAFLGAPPMNLFDSDVVDAGGHLVAEFGGASIPIGIRCDTDAITTRRMRIGLRPERLAVYSGTAPGPPRASPTTGFRIPAAVALTENLGGDVLVHCDVGAVRLCARVPRTGNARSLGTGAAITLAADISDLHMFDPDSGRRVRWQPRPSAATTPRLLDVGAPQ